jgi:hypothetical protein
LVKPKKISIILGVPLLLALALLMGVYMAASSPTPVSSQSPEDAVYESAKLFSFPGDWNQIPDATSRLVYPGKASWQFVTGSLHSGGASVLAGTSCSSCHGSPLVDEPIVAGWAGPPTDHGRGYGCQSCHVVLEQRVEYIGEELVELGPLEPSPIEGKVPYVDVEVQAAYDNEYLYMRFEWASERPGITHDLLRWDGEKWIKWGGDKPGVTDGDIMPSYEDMLTVSVSDRDLAAYDGAQVGYVQAGCFITCHGTGTGIMTKELLANQNAADEVDILQQGNFLDMLTWQAAQSGPIGYANDNFVLDDILQDEGDSSSQTQSVIPRFMYDESKVGFNAIPEELLEEMLDSFPLILGENTAPYDPDASFNIGDIISRRILVEPQGSTADILVNSSWQNGKWVLELRRKLDTGNPDDKAFEVGKVYYISLAVFDDNVSNRRHHVSFPLTLGIGADADIRAERVN